MSEAVAGPVHTASMLEQILTELKKLNANLSKQQPDNKKKKIETATVKTKVEQR